MSPRSCHDHAPCVVPPGTVRRSPIQPDAVVLPGTAARSPVQPQDSGAPPERVVGNALVRTGLATVDLNSPLDEGEAVSSSARTAEFWFDPL